MKINVYPSVRSVASYLIPDKYFLKPGSGGSISARYCYSIWLRHLKLLVDKDFIGDSSEINKIAEIGPGDSLGIGMAALLSGAEEYYGFDVIEHANRERNIAIAEQITEYFCNRVDIPHKTREFRHAKPYLDNYDFPGYIFNNAINNDTLKKRLSEIKKALKGQQGNLKIDYVVPWYDKDTNLTGQIDLIFSQAVMEHVMNIGHAYSTMYRWLKPGGIISHQIDFKAHEMTDEWNGHWFLGERMWNFLLHGRKYPINRYPLSAHIEEIEQAGFTIKNIIPDIKENAFPGKSPKVTKYAFTEKDMTAASALIQAVK